MTSGTTGVELGKYIIEWVSTVNSIQSIIPAIFPHCELKKPWAIFQTGIDIQYQLPLHVHRSLITWSEL